MSDSPPPAKKVCIEGTGPDAADEKTCIEVSGSDFAAEYARLDAAVEAARREQARRDEREAFFRAQWHEAQKDGTPDDEAEALEVRWIAAYESKKEAREKYAAALAAFRAAPLGPVPEYDSKNPGGIWAMPPAAAYPGPSTTGGWTNPHVLMFSEVVKGGVTSGHLQILKPRHPDGRSFYIVEHPECDGGRGTVEDIWALETTDRKCLEERAARWGSDITDRLYIVMNSTGKYYAGFSLCKLHDGPYLPKEQLRTHIRVPPELVSPFMRSVAVDGTVELY